MALQPGGQLTARVNMGEPTVDCEAMQAEIDTLQAEFEGLWIKVSQGGAGGERYRELRHILDDRRAQFKETCGDPRESSTLPRSITSDWRAG
jgi:hypothetical protein